MRWCSGDGVNYVWGQLCVGSIMFGVSYRKWQLAVTRVRGSSGLVVTRVRGSSGLVVTRVRGSSGLVVTRVRGSSGLVVRHLVTVELS